MVEFRRSRERSSSDDSAPKRRSRATEDSPGGENWKFTPGESRSRKSSRGGRGRRDSGSDRGSRRGSSRDSENGSRRSYGRDSDRGSRSSYGRDSDRGSRRRDDSKRGSKNRRDFEMTKVVCDSCGTDCEVPFKPTSNKPIYCDKCYGKEGGKSSSRGSSVDLSEIHEKLDKIMVALKIE